MQVKELMKLLNTMKPDDELVVALWDKKTVSRYIDTEERVLTDDEWKTVASEFAMGTKDLKIGYAIRDELEELMKENDTYTAQFISELENDIKLWKE